MKYRKRPVEVEAMLFDGTAASASAILRWAGTRHISMTYDPTTSRVTRLHVKTLEGTLTAKPGWWILRGVRGELYPCRGDIFRATYEPVTEATR